MLNQNQTPEQLQSTDAAPLPKLSVVIPVHNERENVSILVDQLTQVLQSYQPSYEIVFVDDGSSDGTFDALKAIHSTDPQVRVVRFTRNFGQTPALAAGFDHARGEVVVAMDGDLQFHPEDLPKLVDKLAQGYDLVSGWRDRSHDPAARSIPSRLANMLMASVSGIQMRDFGSTFKAYNRTTLQHLKLYGELHRFIPALASRFGARMTEIPVQWSQRKFGKSHYGLSRTWRVLLDVIAVKFLLSYAAKPLRLFGSIGIFSLIAGFITGAITLLLKIFANFDITGNPLLILTALFIIMGVQFITNGLLAEMLTRTYYEGGSVKYIYTVREVVE
ncbi:MAG: glycosyltransferase family 2 protein [Anaerolineae bacterium]|nr:glycosyltransferase family 2 protein [Anaerolineae bacterium]